MNDEMQKALADILSKTLRGVESAGDFLMSQIPEVIQQLLLYHAVKSFLLMLFCLLTGSLIMFCACRLEKRWKKEGEWVNQGTAFFFGGIATFCCIAGVFFNMQWLQIWLAPKLYLIEYAAKLVKG